MNDIPAADRREVLARSGGRCELRLGGCAGNADAIHHRQLRRHRDHRAVNLLHLCHLCHLYVHEHPEEAYERGWLVSSFRDPADVPVVRPWWTPERPTFAPLDAA